jgi:Glu-tRNA(Gln) amidotransferase subunit E-like FAD-binding protein
MSEAKKIEQIISNRRISEIKIEEVKSIISSMFEKKIKN